MSAHPAIAVSVSSSSGRPRSHVTDLIHLGMLAEYLPPSLVRQVVAESGRCEKRMRALPAVLVVYFTIALALFAGVGYREVLRRVSAHVAPGSGRGVYPIATSSALAKARRRLGAEPLRALFGHLRGSLAAPDIPGAYVFGRRLLLASMDGTTLNVPDTPANVQAFGPPHACGGYRGGGQAGYPQLRLLVLIACGTHGIIDAVFGPGELGEQSLARQLAERGTIGPGTLVLADRAFGGYPLIKQFFDLGVEVIWRISGHLILPRIAEFTDGSYLSVIPEPREGRRRAMARHRGRPLTTTPHGVPVRVIQAQVNVHHPGGRTRTESYRLVTTLFSTTDAPALQIAQLYARRWTSEESYRDLKSTLLDKHRILRSKTPQGIEQELYALLTAHQLLHTVRIDAARHHQGQASNPTQPPTDPDRVSYTVTLRAITRRIALPPHRQRKSRTHALTEILTDLLPARRSRSYPRTPKGSNKRRQAIQTTPPGPVTYTITISKPTPPNHQPKDP